MSSSWSISKAPKIYSVEQKHSCQNLKKVVTVIKMFFRPNGHGGKHSDQYARINTSAEHQSDVPQSVLYRQFEMDIFCWRKVYDSKSLLYNFSGRYRQYKSEEECYHQSKREL